MIVGYVAATAIGLALLADREQVVTWPLVLFWLASIAIGLYAAHVRYVKAGAEDRRRLQWIGWGMAVAAEGTVVVIALRLLLDWPNEAGAVVLALTGFIPIGLACGTLPRMVARVDRLLTHTVAIAGLTALVVAVYVVVILGLGRTPSDAERTLLLLSMVAAGFAALLYLPARRWLTERANRLVYGERVAPDETLRTFGQRLTRSIPMDELLLQLAESLRKSMALTSAEVWTGHAGHYELAAGVPHRHPEPITIGAKELPVVARAGVSGGTWLDVWLPQLVGPGGSAATRVAPIAHAGQLLGGIVVTRPRDGEAFTETRTTCSPSSPGRSALRCTTCSSMPPCRPASTNCSSATRSCSTRGPASSRPAMPSGASSSATCTTARSSTSSPSRSSCASPRTPSRTTPPTPWR